MNKCNPGENFKIETTINRNNILRKLELNKYLIKMN